MKYLRAFLCALGMILAISITSLNVYADVEDGPNTGDYVYQYKAIITKDQYAKLNQINRQINIGVHPQQLNLIIVKNTDELGDNISLEGPDEFNFMSKNRALDLNDTSEVDNPDISKNWAKNGSYLILNLQTNLLYFYPTYRSGGYISDIKYWQYRIGLNGRIKYAGPQGKIDAALVVAQRMVPRMQKIATSTSKKRLYSTSFNDLVGLGNTLSMVAFILQFVVFFIYIKFRKKGDYHGPSESIDSPYDQGFDEGYFMGLGENQDDHYDED